MWFITKSFVFKIIFTTFNNYFFIRQFWSQIYFFHLIGSCAFWQWLCQILTMALSKCTPRPFYNQVESFFLFWMKLWYFTNSRAVISNMTIVFLTFSPENTQIRHFSRKYKEFSFFLRNLHSEKFEDVDSK